MSSSFSYLTTLFPTTGGGSGNTLLDAIYGFTKGTGSSGQDPILALRSAEQNETKDIALTAKTPEVKGVVAAFTAAVNKASSLNQALANPTVMKVLLTASGMSDQLGYTALATKALTSDLSDPKSLVNRLSDKRWKTLAETYNFASNGMAALQSPKAIAAIAQQYAKAVWQTNADSVAPGLTNALYFKANAGGVTSVDQILGDPSLRTVVTTALGIPLEIAFQPLTTQEKAITSRLDISKLQDPKFVEQFTQRYLIANRQNAGGTGTTTASSTSMTALAVQARGILV